MSRQRPGKVSTRQSESHQPLPQNVLESANAGSFLIEPPAPPLGIWERALVVLFLLFTFLTLIFPLRDTDIWWHLRTGEWILAEGKVPQVDLYTFMDSDRPWIDLHWGFQILVTLLYRAGGGNLIILFKALVITSAVAVGFFSTGNRMRVEARILLWLPGVVCICGRGYERPEMISQLFLASWLWIAFRLEKSPRLVWLLPLIQLFWVNFHSLFVLGLVVAGCGVVDWIGRSVLGGRFGIAPLGDRELQSFRTRAFAGILAAAAALVNPYFELGALFPLTVYEKFSTQQDFYSRFVGEFEQPYQFLLQHGPWAFRNIFFLATLVVACIVTCSFFTQWKRGRGISLFRLALFACFGNLAWEATRNANIFAIVGCYIACANYSAAGAFPLREAVPWVSTRRKIFAGGLATLSLLVVTGVWNRVGEGTKPFALGEAPNWYIHDAARFAGKPGMPELAIVNNFGQAAVYVYHNGPERRVLMDGRLEVCTISTFETLLDITQTMRRGLPDWERRFLTSDSPLPVVILDTSVSQFELLGMLETPGWRLVFADKSAGVFLSDKQADQLSLPAVDATELRELLEPFREYRERVLRSIRKR